MKICVLTLPLHFNYGGILQAYALEKVLSDMGHVVEHVEKEHVPYRLPLYKRYFVYAKRFFEKYFLRKTGIWVFFEKYEVESEALACVHTNRFMNCYLKRRIIKAFSDIKESDYDAFVVGSDQVWRYSYFKMGIDSFGGNAFLEFAGNWNVKRLAYAPSFGVDYWEYDERITQIACCCLKKFDGVSVRESSGISFCRDFLGVDAELVLDPTMLLTEDDYKNIVFKSDVQPSDGALLCYLLDENESQKKLIERISSRLKIKPFRGNSKAENRRADVSERIQPPVEKWLRGFIDAEFVVTDSFHACVFSIIFNKPFICLGNKSRGMGRFASLLSMINQSYRLVSDYEDIDNRCFVSPNVDLQEMRQRSLSFLKKHLM